MWNGLSSTTVMHSVSRFVGSTPERRSVLYRVTISQFSFAKESSPSSLPFTGCLLQTLTPHTKNCVRRARGSLSLLKRNLGVCGSSQWRTLMATASTSTVTEQALYNNGMHPTRDTTAFIYINLAGRRVMPGVMPLRYSQCRSYENQDS